MAHREHWLIIADDLTGAADSAIAFAKRRLPSRVTWGEPQPDDDADEFAVAFDADSRRLPAEAAARRHRDILRRAIDPGLRVFKKIDSTLRGHPAHEIGALVAELAAREPGTRAVFAPAFPAGGRVTRAGRVLVRGVPLEQTEFWDRARPGSQAGLPALLESAGLRARPVALDVVRGEPARLRVALDESRGGAVICVCDAESEDDLDRIAAAGLADGHTLFAGSAGLAHSLAERVAPVASVVVKPVRGGTSTRGALLVVGSQAQPSRAALAAATAVRGVRAHTVSAPDLLGSPELAVPVAGLIAAIEDGVDVVIDVAPPAADPPTPAPPASAPLMVDALARRLAPLAQAASALMATGGDTASALLRHAHVRGIRLVDELEPGTSLGLTLGALTKPVITKSGGFGDAGSLLRILERLRSIRLTGTVA